MKQIDKESINKYLGKQPYRKIKPYLIKKKCFNTKGEPYSQKSVENIINGKTNNRIVLTHIFNLVTSEKKELQKLEKLKKQAL